MNFYSRKILSLILFVCINITGLYAQKKGIKDKLGIQSSISSTMASNDKLSLDAFRYFGAAINYGIFDYLEAGPYYKFRHQQIDAYNYSGGYGYGYSPYGSSVYGYSPYGDDYSIPAYTILSSFFGIQSNLHLLPLLIKEKTSRLDIYLTGKFGWAKSNYSSITELPSNLQDESSKDYSYGAGIGYYLMQNGSIFAEYTQGKTQQKVKTIHLGLRMNVQINKNKKIITEDH